MLVVSGLSRFSLLLTTLARFLALAVLPCPARFELFGSQHPVAGFGTPPLIHHRDRLVVIIGSVVATADEFISARNSFKEICR
ncbi:hypothetical protein AWC23_17110 [Mycobacterium saskatchewanense]|uniref:Uncharacterized protein n=1 Tax=Mycobacterium saskatchewanense TaxID=220927 RepID=A0AAJ3NNY1_9MYCO|nr:hypothetical protein AWC23_17110 [Mycobacterium saskatchewanense]